MMNAWYIPMILGVYIFIPYVARILQSLSGKSLIILGLILFSYYFIVPSCNLLLALEKLPRLSPQIDLNYSGGTYGFYLLLGYSYKRYEDRIVSVLKNNKKKILVVLSILLMAACTVLFQNRLYQNHAAYNVWYDFLLLPFIGFCCFMLLCQVKKHYKVFYHLSLYSFAIYLIHVPIIKTLVNFGLYLPNRRLGIYVLWGSTLILSLVCIYILSKIPLFKKYVFMIKE